MYVWNRWNRDIDGEYLFHKCSVNHEEVLTQYYDIEWYGSTSCCPQLHIAAPILREY